MINRQHELPLTRQSQILELSRSSLYYRAVGVSVRDLEMMRIIDKVHLKYPLEAGTSVMNCRPGDTKWGVGMSVRL